MSAPDLIETLQQSLQSPLSDSQVELLSELIAADPKTYDVVMDEIRTQEIEIIPISLSPDDELDELVEWLTQLASTRNVGRGFNTVIASTAAILLIAAIGFGVTFFEFPSADNGNASDASSGEITKVPRQQPDTAEEKPVQKPAGANTEDTGDSGSNSVGQESTGLVLPKLPITPLWLAFDDPAARLDHSWVKSLSRNIRQPLEKPGILKPSKEEGVTTYFDLEGEFLLPPPSDDGSSLRIRLSDLDNMSITVENDLQKIELTYDGLFKLKRYESIPISDFVRALAMDSEPRFRRHFVESRIDPQIDFNWGLAAPVVNDQPVDPDYFAAQWKGFIVIPADGHYIFHMIADDGVRLRINGVQLVDSWAVQPEIELSGAIDLTAGTYPIEVEFFSDRMAARVSLAWESENVTKQIVPSDSLRSTAGSDARPGLTGHYCFGPYVQSGEAPVEQAVDLVDNDNGLWGVFLNSSFDLRFQDKQFVVTRGDIPLTSLPLDSSPTVLKIQTKSRLRYLEPIRLEPLIGLDDNDIDEEHWQAANELPWYVLSDAADTTGKFESGAQGEVRLTRTEGSNPVHLQTNVALDGRTDIYALIKNPMHLTGIRFQHPQNDTLYSLYFMKMGNGYAISNNPTDFGHTSDQYRAGFRFSNQVWWRAHYGTSHFVISMSPDGKHWNSVYTTTLDTSLPTKREIVFGLTTILGGEQSTVSLDKVLIDSDRLIEQLSTFLPVGSVANLPMLVPGTRNTQKLNEFLAELLAQPPETISPETWRLVCYARALKINLTPTMRQEALVRLLHHAILYHPDAARVYEALIKIPERLHIRGGTTNYSWTDIQNLYDLLAARFWFEEKPEKLELLLQQWLRLPGGVGGRERTGLPVAPELLTRLHLYDLRQQGRWQELYEFATKLQYLTLTSHGSTDADREYSFWRTARWLQGEAANILETGHQQVKKPSDIERFLIDRPASVQAERESVNAMREILQAVETGDLDSAVKMITDNPIPVGLFPVDQVGRHFQSAKVYLGSILEEHSELADKIKRENTDLANLRLKKALDAIDMDAIAEIAMRFPGTPAYVQANEMIANHQLSTGSFLTAARNYTDLLAHFPDGSIEKWDAKRKLALALAGRKSITGVEADVELDGESITKDSFNTLLDQLVARRGRQYTKPVKPNLSPKNRSLVSLLDMTLPSKVRSDVRRTRQFGVLDLGTNLLVNQPARLTCFSPNSKQVVWKIEDTGDGMPNEYTHTGDPVLFADGVFVSLFKEKQFWWALINPADGKILWESPAVGIPFGNPIVAGSSIYVLAVTQQKTTFGQLWLQQLDSTSGELVASKPLVAVQIDEDLFRFGRSTIAEDQIIFTLEGVVYSASLAGDLLWARLIDRVPELADQRLRDGVVTAVPLVDGNKILIHAVGSPSLICLDSQTGSLLWKRQQPGLQKLVGIYDQRVILTGRMGIHSIHLEDGSTSWFYPITVNPQSVLIHNDHVLALNLDKPQPLARLTLESSRKLLWIHPQTGRVEHEFSLLDETPTFIGAEQLFSFADQVVVVSNVDVNARTFKLLGLPVK
jgi:outer membrane protein assembly factor BamB